jgi:hypothetical protein
MFAKGNLIQQTERGDRVSDPVGGTFVLYLPQLRGGLKRRSFFPNGAQMTRGSFGRHRR